MSRLKLLAAALLALYATAAFAMGARPETPATIEFKGKIKGLFLDRIQYERAFALFTKDNNPDAARVSGTKAAENASALASAIGRYYGTPATVRLHALFLNHYEGVREYALASYANNGGGKNAASAKLYRNAEDMTAFLASINPYVSRGVLKPLLEADAGNAVSEIDAIASKDQAAEKEVYEIMQKNVKILSDDLSEAIIRQFPKSF